MTEITRTNVGDQLILAIGQQLEANRKLCEQTPAWETWTVREEFRENTSEGYVRWEPSVWLELTKTQQNYVSTAIKALAESGVVDTVMHTPPRIYWVRLADTGMNRLKELDRKLARRLSRPMTYPGGQ